MCGRQLLLAVLLSAHLQCLLAATHPKAEELKAAINAEYQFRPTNWDLAILNDTLSNLKLEHILWSNKPPRFQFTVFTQLTVNRLPTLFNMCTTFTGPLSAAVYLGLVQAPDSGSGQAAARGLLKQRTGGHESHGEQRRQLTGATPAGQQGQALEQERPGSNGRRQLSWAGQQGGGLSAKNAALVAEAVEQVERLHSRVEALPAGCQLDVMLFWEVFDSEQSRLLYPVNYLRNYARMQVRTRLLAMIDVDMYMSRTLSEEMEGKGGVARYEALCGERRATVLPAFEPTKPGAAGRELATNLTTVSKSSLQSMHGRNKAAIQFKLRVFPRGHTPTDYVRWFASSEPYQVTYKRFYEPWFITCDEIMPWYDVDFRGYGMNKIVLIAALNYYNYSFWVHPGAWLVHNPHGDTEVRKLVAREASDVNKLNVKLPANALYRKLTLLFGSAKRRMVRGTYDPRVDPRMLAVYDKVPWLRPPPLLVGTPMPESVFT